MSSQNQQEIKKYNQCFVCGDKNEIGLNVKFYYQEGKAQAEYLAGKNFEGYQDILHGGIITSLLDEVMIKSVIAKNISVLTVEINVKFKKPVFIGEKIYLTGEMTKEQGKIVFAKGEAKNQKGEIVALGEAKFFKVDEKMKEFLNQGLE
jgi:uncharacterized protein (TIGR00369 family)